MVGAVILFLLAKQLSDMCLLLLTAVKGRRQVQVGVWWYVMCCLIKSAGWEGSSDQSVYLIYFHPNWEMSSVLLARKEKVIVYPSHVIPGATGWLGGLSWRWEGWWDPLSSDEEQQLCQSHGRWRERRVGLQPQGITSKVGAAWCPG